MSNRKINYKRKVPSSETIKKRQNFDDILSNVKVVPTPFFKSIGFWGAVGSSVIALTLLTYQFLNTSKKKDAYDATPTLAITPSELPKDTKCITPINDDHDKALESVEIDPLRSNTVYVEGGAVITIPKDAFENANSGKVTIQTRVFRDKSEAFMAGIPMDYGTLSAFESAGMIEIRGVQNGQELKLKEGKEIEVSLGLHKSPETFDFYALGESTGKWSEYNASFEYLDNETVSLKKIRDEVKETDQEIVELDAAIKSLVKPSLNDYHLAENDQRVFELKFNKHEFPELKSFERIQFEAKCSSIQYHEILEKTWSDVELKQVPNGQYEAEFANQRGDTRAIKVVPVVTGDQAEVAYEQYVDRLEEINKERAQKEKKLENLKEENEARRKRIQGIVSEQESDEVEQYKLEDEAAIQERKEKMAMLTEFYNASATFTTNRWGLFNCDKPVNYPKAPASPYAFAANNSLVKPNRVYVFDLKKDVRYEYGTTNHPLNEVALNNNETVIVVRDRAGNMSYARVEGKNKMPNGYNIDLTPIDAKEADMDFFKKLLDEEKRVRA